MKSVLAHHDAKTVAMMTMLSARAEGSSGARDRANADLEDLRQQIGDTEFLKRKDEATKLMESTDKDTLKAFRRAEMTGKSGLFSIALNG